MLQPIIDEAYKKFKTFDPPSVVPMFAENNKLPLSDGLKDVYDMAEVGNYAFFPGLIEVVKPKQMIELGSAMGVALNCMLASNYKDFELYGVTLEEHGLEFCFVKKDTYSNLHMITGDYMDMSIWPKEVDLGKTDLWYIDGLHEGPHVKEQLLLYKPFLKEGAIICFDDIFMNPGMTEMWHDLENIIPVKEKMVDYQLHWTGWGIVEVGK